MKARLEPGNGSSSALRRKIVSDSFGSARGVSMAIVTSRANPPKRLNMEDKNSLSFPTLKKADENQASAVEIRMHNKMKLSKTSCDVCCRRTSTMSERILASFLNFSDHKNHKNLGSRPLGSWGFGTERFCSLQLRPARGGATLWRMCENEPSNVTEWHGSDNSLESGCMGCSFYYS